VFTAGGNIFFYGGEDYNAAHSLVHNITNGNVVVRDRIVTYSGGGTTVSVNGTGSYTMKGRCRLGGPITVATGTLDLSDPSVYGGSGYSVTGSSGTVIIAPKYNYDNGPNLSGYTGTIQYTGTVPILTATGNNQTSLVTQTFTPPVGINFRVNLWIRVTVAGTSTVPNISYTEYQGGTTNAALPMWRNDGSSTTPTYTLANVAAYTGTFFGESQAGGGSPITITITPTGSTFRYVLYIEQLL
jgi:hypothetical protein